MFVGICTVTMQYTQLTYDCTPIHSNKPISDPISDPFSFWIHPLALPICCGLLLLSMITNKKKQQFPTLASRMTPNGQVQNQEELPFKATCYWKTAGNLTKTQMCQTTNPTSKKPRSLDRSELHRKWADNLWPLMQKGTTLIPKTTLIGLLHSHTCSTSVPPWIISSPTVQIGGFAWRRPMIFPDSKAWQCSDALGPSFCGSRDKLYVSRNWKRYPIEVCHGFQQLSTTGSLL